MDYARISLVLSPEDLASLRQGIADLDQLVSAYAVNLSPEDRKTVYKMGDRSRSFVEQGLKYAKDHPEFVPPFLNPDEYQKDWDLSVQGKDLVKLLEPVMEKLVDTQMVAGAEAFAAARSMYDALKQAAKNNEPGADSLVAEMKKRFHRGKSPSTGTEKKESTTTTTTSTTTPTTPTAEG
jgi:hypothetical protein